ncbi:uncharacterized protein DUF1416 [Stackebrandtia albiflava]|uniref:Uncharacterized protein DUF1416 n=1 Tax=Stackebrandtia albiflava TaxID=406432 RepID=A0A562UYX3_9ACTN|nr:DUF1416 domain-containing protein [Stackebrandtia albiflava]TWJ10844.1 uncharacterized protein DUF1416 [Stackebrandtia albiflava]
MTVNQTAAGCAAPAQGGPLPASVNLATETVVSGRVVNASGDPVTGAYVRLLDGGGEFTAEVVTGEGGVFRFFAAPGGWTLRALSRDGDGSLDVTARQGLNEVTVGVNR